MCPEIEVHARSDIYTSGPAVRTIVSINHRVDVVLHTTVAGGGGGGGGGGVVQYSSALNFCVKKCFTFSVVLSLLRNALPSM